MARSSRTKQRLANAAMVLVSTLISLFVADFALTVLKLPKENSRIALLSGSSLSTDSFGVRRYEPNKNVEQAALIDSKIAYRYKYRTNNLGFVSEYDYQPGNALDLLITGDSVTEGQEVGPWLDDIQRYLFTQHGITSQNMGIAGNGFVEFEKAASYGKSQLKARKAMLIFIADDMYRPGDIMDANKECSTYRSYTTSRINCFSGRPTWHNYDSTLSDTELRQYAEGLKLFGLWQFVRRPLISAGMDLARLFCKTGLRVPEIGALAHRINSECTAYGSVIPEQRTSTQMTATLTSATPASAAQPPAAAPAQGSEIAATQPVPNYTVEALHKIISSYGVENVILIMIPGGGYSFKAIQPQQFFAKAFKDSFGPNLNFSDISESCEMPKNMWSPGGGHPTREGYLKLQSCILANDKIMAFAMKK